jgi:glycosyltransferase involved in cell wall biosynthesis
MSQIRICHISQSAGAGVETYILNILKYSDKKTFRHIVICSDTGTLADRAKAAGAEVISLPMVREIAPIRDLFCVIKLLPIVYRLKVDLIHAHSGKGGIYGRLCGAFLGKAVAFTPHAFSYLGLTGFRRSMVLCIEKLLKYTNAYLLATSPSEAGRAIKEVGWHPKKVLAQFPNSVEVPPKIIRRATNKRIRVLMIGRITYQKNPEMFLRVSKLAGTEGKITFTILGAGYGEELEEKVKTLVEDMGLKNIVGIKPWRNSTGVREELINSDIYISTSRYESFGLATAEAMAHGLPVIGTMIDGNVDLIDENKNGFLVEVDDDAAMAANIIKLANNIKLRTKLGNAGRCKIDKIYNINKNIHKLEEIYHNLCGL